MTELLEPFPAGSATGQGQMGPHPFTLTHFTCQRARGSLLRFQVIPATHFGREPCNVTRRAHESQVAQPHCYRPLARHQCHRITLPTESNMEPENIPKTPGPVNPKSRLNRPRPASPGCSGCNCHAPQPLTCWRSSERRPILTIGPRLATPPERPRRYAPIRIRQPAGRARGSIAAGDQPHSVAVGCAR